LSDKLAVFFSLVTEKQRVLGSGIFDHLDSNGAPLGSFLDQRLRLLELIEQAGFAAYDLAEHHSTPLGMDSSPGVFLASAIQGTGKIRLGPLVYVLPLYYPLRFYEEICMLDHLSNGRIMVGVGRGGTLVEHQCYGIEPTERDYIARLQSEAGINYVLCQMVFGDIDYDDASYSIRLVASEAMPAFS
jgi:alkanesulfonate monooxygenase SsuD/methylene tetrahydromethanopterin reductase-like flavin-dependent oxidoreductase (luciferase family)